MVEEALSAAVDPPLGTPKQPKLLTPSLALGIEELSWRFNQRSCSMIGILGLPGAGKTAALVSLYLLLSNAELQSYEYRDSDSLIAFEQLSRGARHTEQLDQITAHTEITDGRTAAFLHLRTFDRRTSRVLDLLLPDLPGEWTSDLINHNRTDRFSFLGSCASIWIFVDGRKLLDQQERNPSLRSTELVVRRIVALLGENCPPLRLVLTHADAGEIGEAVISKLTARLVNDAPDLSVTRIASFSSADEIPAGFGLETLLESSLAFLSDASPNYVPEREAGRRAVLNFRGNIE